MTYELDDVLKSLPEGISNPIGNFSVTRAKDFLVFTPAITYRGVAVNRLRIRASTFKNFGAYTLPLLFMKLIPSISNHS
jgi:hypothetical protein